MQKLFSKQINIAGIHRDPLTEKVDVSLSTLRTRLRDTVSHRFLAQMGSQRSRWVSAARHRQWDKPPLCHMPSERSCLLTGSSVSTAKESKINWNPSISASWVWTGGDECAADNVPPSQSHCLFTSPPNFHCKSLSGHLLWWAVLRSREFGQRLRTATFWSRVIYNRRRRKISALLVSAHMQSKQTKHPSSCTILVFKYSALSVPPFLIHH